MQTQSMTLTQYALGGEMILSIIRFVPIHTSAEKGMKMPKLKWWQYLAVGSFVAGWLTRALADGKVSRPELDELINGILDILGIEDITIVD